MGSVDLGGSGCICPEAAMLKTLFTHLLFRKDDVLLLDMYAGVEHLGRATADRVDALLIVVEPTARSLATAAQMKRLAIDIKIPKLYLIGNKVQSQTDRDFIAANSPGLPVIGFLSAEQAVLEADRARQPVYDLSPVLAKEILSIVKALRDLEQGA